MGPLRWRLHGEVSAYLVGAPAFKAGVAGDPRQAGSIPVHLRQYVSISSRLAQRGSFVRLFTDISFES